MKNILILLSILIYSCSQPNESKILKETTSLDSNISTQSNVNKENLKDNNIISKTKIIDTTSKRVYNNDSIEENKVYKLIFDLIETKCYFRKIDSLYQNKAHAIVIIASKPTKEEPYYWVQVGVNDGNRIVPEYNFYVYPKKMKVMFYDTLNDRILTLKQWRNLNK